MIKKFNANHARLRRHQRMRRYLAGKEGRPRLNVFRSGHHIYAQVIDDVTGRTLASASTLDDSLQNFTPPEKPSLLPQTTQSESEPAVAEEAATEQTSTRARNARPAAPAKGGNRPGTQVKTVLPTAVKGNKKNPVEALAAISTNRKVALAREVGKLVAERAKEQGVSSVVFDRGGYAYHGRVAALAEGAREAGLSF